MSPIVPGFAGIPAVDLAAFPRFGTSAAAGPEAKGQGTSPIDGLELGSTVRDDRCIRRLPDVIKRR